jgi:ketosteroid isomerase-like protein
MYHTVVRAQIKKLFSELNKGNYEPILGACAPTFEHWFVGKSHALAGRRTSIAVTRSWYERLFNIFPNIQFELHQVLVTGWPWNTVVAVEWSDYYTLFNGEKRQNCGVHLIRLKWGKGTSVRIYCDTQLLQENLAIQHRGGVQEAAASPLVG